MSNPEQNPNSSPITEPVVELADFGFGTSAAAFRQNFGFSGFGFRTSIALVLVVITAFSTLAALLPSQPQILSDMVLANNYFMNEWGATPGCNTCLPGSHPSTIWTRGTYFEGALALYRINQDPTIYNYAVDWGSFPNWGLRYGDTDTNADSQCAPQSYIELYQFDTTQTNRLTHPITNANFWCNSSKVGWGYVDALHMSMPMFAKLAAITGSTNYPAKMYSWFHLAKSVYGASNGLYNLTDHLWWRDATFVSNYKAQDGTAQKCYWSRGNGWAIAALARTMDVLSTNDAHFPEYLQTFRDMAGAIRAVQRTDGFWNVNLAYTNDYPGPETTGTALFTYGMAWGLNRGYLNTNLFLPIVINGWNALANGALHHSTNTDNGFLGYVQSTGSKPADGQPVTYTSIPNFDDYGLGCFLLAGSQVYALKAKWTFAAFQNEYFTAAELADPSISGPGADPDGDGLNNLEEYAFGLNPHQLDSRSVWPSAAISNGYLTLTFIRRHDVADLAYIPETSTDLITWNSGSAFTQEISVTPLDAQRDLVTVQDLASVSSVSPHFLRLRLQTN
jgi:rhamnogalacturonyl hydrolase YesR